MPFQSEKQRRYLWANEPEIARDWTETYGNRISKDDGGIMHQFENYAHEDGDNVSVPRSFQARPHSDQVNLAYITPREAGILQSLKPGTPHRGPMEVPNYDSFDAAGGYTSGAAMSAAETGSRNQRDRAEVRASNIGGPKGLAPGVTSNQAQELRNASIAAGAMGQRGSGFNFNPLSIIGGAFGNVGRGIGFLLGKGKNFAGKMRGGINPATGKYYTQKEYEEARQKRRGQASIDRILRTKGKYDSGEIDRDWDQSPLKARLAGLQDLTGYTGESAQGKNELGLYTDRITPGTPGLRVGEEQGYYGPGSIYDKQGITGTDASMDFGRARRAMTQSSQIPGANPLWTTQRSDPYQENFLMDPNTVFKTGMYESPKRSAKDFIDLDKASWEGKETIPEDKYKGLGIQRNYMEGDLPLSMAPFKGERDKITDMKNVAFVKDKFLKEQPFYNEKLNFKPHNLTAYGLGSSNPAHADLYKKLGNPNLTVGKLLQELQTGKYDVLPEKIVNKLKEHILEKVDFGDTFQENWSTGVVEPTFKGNRLDIDEGDLEVEEMKVKPSDVLEIAEGGRITKALGGRSRDI